MNSLSVTVCSGTSMRPLDAFSVVSMWTTRQGSASKKSQFLGPTPTCSSSCISSSSFCGSSQPSSLSYKYLVSLSEATRCCSSMRATVRLMASMRTRCASQSASTHALRTSAMCDASRRRAILIVSCVNESASIRKFVKGRSPTTTKVPLSEAGRSASSSSLRSVFIVRRWSMRRSGPRQVPRLFTRDGSMARASRASLVSLKSTSFRMWLSDVLRRSQKTVFAWRRRRQRSSLGAAPMRSARSPMRMACAAAMATRLLSSSSCRNGR
mmetsp:Transcript_6574/g.18633  ORF Transcript_6574/g.18633 Transcript_6574/m.18633 type:complete len:268 (-) Transcript_6574:1931-2734(-)